MVRPFCRVSKRAMSSRCASSRSASRRSSDARCFLVMRDQFGSRNAARAAPTARLTSSWSPTGTAPITSSVAGLMTACTALAWAATNRPSTKIEFRTSAGKAHSLVDTEDVRCTSINCNLLSSN